MEAYIVAETAEEALTDVKALYFFKSVTQAAEARRHHGYTRGKIFKVVLVEVPERGEG